MLDIIKNDPWLAPYNEAIEGRHSYYLKRLTDLTKGGKITLSDFATGHLWFGLHRSDEGWVLREWAPNATEIFLIGTFNQWQRMESYRLKKKEGGVWEVKIPAERISHGDLYKLHVSWPGGTGERIPAWAKRVVQDETTTLFSAQVWEPEQRYQFRNTHFKADTSPLLIYETHVGMSTAEEKVGSYNEFREKVLPRVKENGYNAIQIMAIQEHPYYGSFGYHVSSFFAPSSRNGTPEELRELIDTAHGMGIAVIMDIVHSHAVKNEVEGLGRMDGSYDLYFHSNPERRYHQAWDSLCFDYGKDEVLHFLLSNCKYWLDEFRFDGFRFDGVTSMIYRSHGLGEAFSNYGDYYNAGQDGDAICYLTLANKLIHEVNPNAITIAEEVSGMPGLAAPATPENPGAIGFDRRMAMGVSDLWFKLFDLPDESWNVAAIFHELVNRRPDERVVSYVECHDQALVGGKTAIFTLADAEMYRAMHTGSQSLAVDRAVALHKLIRLATYAAAGDGYLNFMGNEFGHPEWIDFPRAGNGWSCEHARRLWHLADDPGLRYRALGEFDRAMLEKVPAASHFPARVQPVRVDEEKQVLIFERAGRWFCFNFNPLHAFTDYRFPALPGEYSVVLDSDDTAFGGFSRQTPGCRHFTLPAPGGAELALYLPPRTALVLRRLDAE